MAGVKAVDPRVTYAELARWPEDGRRYELYDGEAIVVPAPNFRHQRIVTNLLKILKDCEGGAGGAVVGGAVRHRAFRIRRPPARRRLLRPRKGGLLDPESAAYVVPDLAVEVLSRSTERRDRGRKLELLARHGLPEYWLIDPAHRSLEICARRVETLTPLGTFLSGRQIETPTLPGVAIEVARLFDD